MLYISTSVWVLRTPNAGRNSHFQRFLLQKTLKKAKNMHQISTKKQVFWICTRTLVEIYNWPDKHALWYRNQTVWKLRTGNVAWTCWLINFEVKIQRNVLFILLENKAVKVGVESFNSEGVTPRSGCITKWAITGPRKSFLSENKNGLFSGKVFGRKKSLEMPFKEGLFWFIQLISPNKVCNSVFMCLFEKIQLNFNELLCVAQYYHFEGPALIIALSHLRTRMNLQSQCHVARFKYH